MFSFTRSRRYSSAILQRLRFSDLRLEAMLLVGGCNIELATLFVDLPVKPLPQATLQRYNARQSNDS